MTLKVGYLRAFKCVLIALVAMLSSTSVRATTPTQEQDGRITSEGSVAFRALWGVPDGSVDRVLRYLDGAATGANLALLNFEDADGDYQLWGEVQFEGQGENRVLYYAWVAYNRQGAFIGKASGSSAVKRVSNDIWAGVPDLVWKKIAADALAALTNRDRAKPRSRQTLAGH